MYLGLIIQNVKDRVPSRTPRLTRFVLLSTAKINSIFQLIVMLYIQKVLTISR